MNKRIALIDPKEIPIARMYGKGLDPAQIFTLESLESYPIVKKMDILKFEEGDAVMLVGKEPFNYLQNWYHYGVRNENYADCAKLKRLSMTGGGFAKCLIKEPTKDEILEFLNPNYTTPVSFDYKQKNLKTYDDAIRFLSWLESRPEEEDFGYDYEGSGMPLDKWYELSGVSICNYQYGGFLALTDIRENSTETQYREVLRRLGEWVAARMNHIWTYNMQYEYQVSHRILGIDAYDLCDASVVNILDGHHKNKKYSLKWTAQRVLKVNVWDQHFDMLSDLLEAMYFTTVGKTKAEKQKVFKVTKDNFKNSSEWKKIIEMFPVYESEFERLILKYWGSPFMNIPSDILGYYCNLDAFYTLQIYLHKKDEYSEEAWNVFLDNIRLGCRLHSMGLYINEDFRYKYKLECEKMMAWGITYTATARCRIKMKIHEAGAADINKYPPICKLLLEHNKFYSGDVNQILKDILLEYVDENESYETGLDEGLLLMNLGSEFAEGFIDIVKEVIKEVDLKNKINQSIVRKRKFMGLLVEKFTTWSEIDKVKVDKKPHQELEQLLYFQRAYQELKKVSQTQLRSVYDIPLKITAFGKEWEAKDYSDFVSENYFKCKSPIENDNIIQEFFDIYKSQVAWLAALGKSVNQLSGGKKYYANLGINTPDNGYNHFMTCWQNATENGLSQDDPYPSKMYTEALRFWQKGLDAVDGKGTQEVYPVKEVWTNFSMGVGLQRDFWKDYCDSMIYFYEAPFQDSDLNSDFTFIRKFSIHYLFFKKYSKVLSTYIDGMFKANNKWVIEGEDRIPIREADPDEPGAVEKCFVHYEINTKSSKRHSSGFHTILSHSDIKDCVTTPPVWDPVNGKWIYGASDTLLMYYDISSAEVRAAAAASKDPELNRLFREGIDVYINTAKLYYKNFDSLPKSEQKEKRKQFKTIFLGLLYGLGIKSLAERLNCSEEEAKKIIEATYQAYPMLREYIAYQQQYPLDHNGLVNTIFGDKLKVQEYDWLQSSNSMGEVRSLTARINRLGVNLPIQGGTSEVMSCGFFNTIRQSIKAGWEMPISTYIIVHDSSTSAIQVSKLFELRPFLDKHYTDYCMGLGSGVCLKFDLLQGNSYESAAGVSQIDENTLEYKGNAITLLPIYDKIMNCSSYMVECSMKREDIIPKYVTSPVLRFIKAKGTSMSMDESEYKIQFKKVS